MNQDQVRETYLRVINATIESVREEFTERAVGDNVIESLDLLKQRWEARLTQTHDFTEDPEIVDKPSVSAARGGKKAASKPSKKKGTANSNATRNDTSAGPKTSPINPPSSRNGIAVADLTNDVDEAVSQPLPPVPRLPIPKEEPDTEVEVVQVKMNKVEPVEVEDSKAEQPPTKRARTETPDDDDGVIDNVAEDLDSSDDSDVAGDESDEEVENLVLAQHEKVKKGNKWKIILKDGIISIRGREYLFNKATCDLDF